MHRSALLGSKGGKSNIDNKAPSLTRFPTDLGVSETVRLQTQTPMASTSSIAKGYKKSSKGRSSTGWPPTGFGNLSSPVKPSFPSTTTTPTSKLKRKATDPNLRSESTSIQSKLASFGFFSDKPARPVRGFDQEWDEEEDLPLDMLDYDHQERDHNAHQLMRRDTEVMMAIPEALPHPDLRPAGLRELKRRRLMTEQERDQGGQRQRHDLGLEQPVDEETEGQERLLPEASTLSSQLGISTDDQSSLTTDDDIGMNGSMAAWYAGLGDRRSSEFGSLS